MRSCGDGELLLGGGAAHTNTNSANIETLEDAQAHDGAPCHFGALNSAIETFDEPEPPHSVPASSTWPGMRRRVRRTTWARLGLRRVEELSQLSREKRPQMKLEGRVARCCRVAEALH